MFNSSIRDGPHRRKKQLRSSVTNRNLFVATDGGYSLTMTTVNADLNIEVFISYAREDFAFAEALFEYCTDMGCSPWMDKKSLLGAEDFRLAISDAIRRADYAITVLSRSSVDKDGFVQLEFRKLLTRLAEHGANSPFLIPIRIDGAKIPDLSVHEFSISLRDYNWIDLPGDLPWSAEMLEPLAKALSQRHKPKLHGAPQLRGAYGRADWPIPNPIDDNLLALLRLPAPTYTIELLDLESIRYDPEIRAKGHKLHRLYNAGEIVRGDLVASDAWLIAAYLHEQILQNNAAAFASREYRFPIHQFLSAMIRRSNDETRRSIFSTLVRWLGDPNLFSTTRNFSAFELGMCGFVDASPVLLSAVTEETETPEVRRYAAIALGMVKAVEFISDLGLLANRTSAADLRTVLLHVILHLSNLRGRR